LWKASGDGPEGTAFPEEKSVGRRQPRSRSPTLQNIQPMPQHGDLGFQLRLCSQRRGKRVEKQPQQLVVCSLKADPV
jgi:hypothetical protein